MKMMCWFLILGLFLEHSTRSEGAQDTLVKTIAQRQPTVLKAIISPLIVSAYEPELLKHLMGERIINISVFDPTAPDPKMPSNTITCSFTTFLSGTIKQPGKRVAFRQVFTPDNYDDPLIKPIAQHIAILTKPVIKHELILRMTLDDWEFPLHFDPTDNLFCQLFGVREVLLMPFDDGQKIVQKKELISFDELTSTLPSLNGISIRLEPGDCLFIPAGWYHLMRALPKSTITTAASLVFQMPGIDYAILSATFDACYPAQQKRLVERVDDKNITNHC